MFTYSSWRSRNVKTNMTIRDPDKYLTGLMKSRVPKFLRIGKFIESVEQLEKVIRIVYATEKHADDMN